MDLTEGFTGFYPYPKDDADLKPYTHAAATLFLPFTLKGKVVPFDFKEKRWCKFLPVPEHDKRFAFMGGPISHKGRYYFSLSTYNGTNVGCDGQPYHFCNEILQFDPDKEIHLLDAGSKGRLLPDCVRAERRGRILRNRLEHQRSRWQAGPGSAW